MTALPGGLMTSALEAFGARLVAGARPTDARSGAGVHRVRVAGDTPAYLKVTPVGLGATARAAAERELRFYREIAPAVPVRAPLLLDALDIDEGLALLLSDAGEQRPATDWTDTEWGMLGRDLARLHTTPLAAAPPGGEPWAGGWDRPDDLLVALASSDPEPVVAFWSAHLPQLGDLLAGRFALRDRLRSVPRVFVHGDCHTGNVVHGPDGHTDSAPVGLVFCDWQVCGAGRASSDLAFLSVRATPSGVRIPAVLVDEYLRQCAQEGAVQDAVEFRQRLAVEELAVLVWQWPPFAAYNDAAGIARVQRRARYLAERLDE